MAGALMANTLTTLTEHIFDIAAEDGAVYKIRRGGNPNGHRLFLSNGNGFAIDGYRVFWEPLLEDFDLVLFDMRNHGRNDPVGADRHSYFQMARDLDVIFHETVAKLGPKKNIGVFHSMASRTAMKHAVQMRWVWDALVIFDPPNVPLRGHPNYEAMRGFELKLSQWAANRQDIFSDPSELVAYWAENRAQRRWLHEAREDMANAVLRPDGEGSYVLSCRRELEASIYLAALSMDLWPPASAYGGPVKMIGADPDDPGGPPIGAANRALARDGDYVYEAVPETGHLLQIERPGACRDAMLSFLRDLSLS
jgi:pimeloyl-ACP methyl ester carboxylesterase